MLWNYYWKHIQQIEVSLLFYFFLFFYFFMNVNEVTRLGFYVVSKHLKSYSSQSDNDNHKRNTHVYSINILARFNKLLMSVSVELNFSGSAKTEM